MLLFFCILSGFGIFAMIIAQINWIESEENICAFYAILGFIALDVGNEMMNVNLILFLSLMY